MKKLIPFLVLCTMLIGCGKSAEVTVVDDSNDVLPSENTAKNSQASNQERQDDFRKIVIGESGEIQTLDPLFANSSSELRIISMIYDGLTKLDENGSPTGAIAKKWSITRDSLTYTFTLRENAFYHNDSRFTSGLGRQVTPQDVMMNFRRMASLEVPDNAADMFTAILGFNAFHSEQTNIKIPGNRVINSIEGVSSETDSTLTIRLSEKDSKLLKKLAHPWASIYPPQSLPDNKLPISRPIGTGEFYLAQRQTNTLILASFDNYIEEQNLPTRVDVIYGKGESDIYQDLAKGTVDALIEPTPKTLLQVSDSVGNIDPIFEKSFALDNQRVFNMINLYHNPSSENPRFLTYLNSLDSDFAMTEPVLGEFMIKNQAEFNGEFERNSLEIAYTENPTELFLINKVADQYSAKGLSVTLNSSYAVTDDVIFSTRVFTDANIALTWNYPVFILSNPTVSGINISHHPWNISYDGAIVNKK